MGDAHVQRYRETDGEVGYEWNGVPTLLLTTVGRRSGEQRTSALIFARDGDDERPRLWKIVTDVWPNYDTYQSRTDRVIPIVVLARQ